MFYSFRQCNRFFICMYIYLIHDWNNEHKSMHFQKRPKIILGPFLGRISLETSSSLFSPTTPRTAPDAGSSPSQTDQHMIKLEHKNNWGLSLRVSTGLLHVPVHSISAPPRTPGRAPGWWCWPPPGPGSGTWQGWAASAPVAQTGLCCRHVVPGD